jgi:hypothetical protein
MTGTKSMSQAQGLRAADDSRLAALICNTTINTLREGDSDPGSMMFFSE